MFLTRNFPETGCAHKPWKTFVNYHTYTSTYTLLILIELVQIIMSHHWNHVNTSLQDNIKKEQACSTGLYKQVTYKIRNPSTLENVEWRFSNFYCHFTKIYYSAPTSAENKSALSKENYSRLILRKPLLPWIIPMSSWWFITLFEKQ